MIKVAINGRFLSRQLTGVDRFAIETIKGIERLLEHDKSLRDQLQIRLLIPTSGRVDICLKHITVQPVGRLHGLLWEQISLPMTLRTGEQLINLCNVAPIWKKSQVCVVHDAATKAMPEVFSWKFRLWYQFLLPVLFKTASYVLTVSEFSRADIAKRFSLPLERLKVMQEGGEHILNYQADPTILAKHGLDRRPYIFAVSSMAKHKNFRLILDALNRLGELPFDCAIAGGSNSKVFSSATLDQSESVRWLGYVSNEELRTLYENALCFVFPSTYEGFGIPPLEAMNCGVPVLASNAASIPEVCGDAAEYFDPYDADELAQKLLFLYKNEHVKASLSAKSRQRAEYFSWEQAAYSILSCITGLSCDNIDKNRN